MTIIGIVQMGMNLEADPVLVKLSNNWASKNIEWKNPVESAIELFFANARTLLILVIFAIYNTFYFVIKPTLSMRLPWEYAGFSFWTEVEFFLIVLVCLTIGQYFKPEFNPSPKNSKSKKSDRLLAYQMFVDARRFISAISELELAFGVPFYSWWQNDPRTTEDMFHARTFAMKYLVKKAKLVKDAERAETEARDKKPWKMMKYKQQTARLRNEFNHSFDLLTQLLQISTNRGEYYTSD